jgi:hypothetical protein
MGSKQKRKRERNKRARRRARSEDAEGPNSFSFGPVSFTQEGRAVQISVDQDHPTYEAFHAAQKQQIDETPELTLRLREEIAELAAPYHAFDVVLPLWLTYGMAGFESLTPLRSDGFPRAAEYVAHVLLERPSPKPLRVATKQEMANGVDVEGLGKRVGEIVAMLGVWFYERQRENADDPLDPWLELRTRFYMQRLAIGSFVYEWEEEAILRELFDPFSEQLGETLGFDASQAIALEKAMTPLLFEGINGRVAKATEFAEEMRTALAAARKGEAIAANMPREAIEWLATRSKKEAEKRIEGQKAAWVSLGIGQDASFTAEQLAAAAAVPLSAAEAFLDSFSVRFGERPDAHQWERDPEKAVGGELQTMREVPILDDGAGGYLPIALDSILYGIRDVLTDALKLTRRWARFDRHRAHVLEGRAVAALDRALGADFAHAGIHYRYLDENGEEKEGEADGVIRVGTLAMLVECKAGALAPSARRAAPGRLERGLKDQVVAAHDQLKRSHDALIGGEAKDVRDADGKPLRLDLTGVSRTLRIAVTLGDLSPVAPAVWQLQEAGLLPADERAPWVVGLHELELICELSEGPAQLVHYILRRQRSFRQKHFAMDELDFFMKYLSDGLFFEDEELTDTRVELHSHTDALDRYLYGERGLRPKAERPAQRIDSATRRLLEKIAAAGGPTSIEAQVMILEMDEDSRQTIAGCFEKLTAMVASDGEPHDATLPFQDDFAVTIHCVPAELEAELPKRLRNHGERRAELSNLRRWLGLGILFEDDPEIRAMVVMLDPSRLEDP